MRLKRVQITNYRSVNDTGWFEVEPDKTVLVGPNEAGKTAVLKALETVSMPPPQKPNVDPLRDYPRARYATEIGITVEPRDAPVASAEFELDDIDRAQIAEVAPHLGAAQTFMLTSYHNNEIRYLFDQPTRATLAELEAPLVRLRTKIDGLGHGDLSTALDGIVSTAQLAAPSAARTQVVGKLATDLTNWLSSVLGTVEFDDVGQKAFDEVRAIVGRSAATSEAYKVLAERRPFFVYYSSIFKVRPRIHLSQLAAREAAGDIDDEYDFGNLCLLKLLGFTARELADAGGTPPAPPHGQTEPTAEDIKAYQDRLDERNLRLNAAAVRLTNMVREVWGDEEMTLDFRVDGQYLKVVVRDELGVEVELDQRSEGFRWLVSFFVVFTAQAQDKLANAILLLDEPGVSLHGLKQKQFRLTVSKLAEKNQVLFTTHSPFMVGTDELDKVRIVEMKDRTAGTKVHEDFAVDDPRSLFPLQAHFGYELGQTLFGQHRNLVVEGITDYWYLEALAEAATDSSAPSLDQNVTVLPAGDAGKVVYHATILNAQALKVAALFDGDPAGKQAAANETLVHVLKPKQILNVADFYEGPVKEPEFEDLLRTTLLTVAKEELGIDATAEGNKRPNQPICDLLASVGGAKFSKYRLGKGFIRWARAHGWSDLTSDEQKGIGELFAAAHKALK